jgi:hypothetical protein
MIMAAHRVPYVATPPSIFPVILHDGLVNELSENEKIKKNVFSLKTIQSTMIYVIRDPRI